MDREAGRVQGFWLECSGSGGSAGHLVVFVLVAILPRGLGGGSGKLLRARTDG